MSTAARKARKRAGISFAKAQKTAKRPYETAYEAKKRRSAERRSEAMTVSAVSGIVAAMNNSLNRFRRGAR